MVRRLAVAAAVLVVLAAVTWWSSSRAAPADLGTVVEQVRREFPDVPRLTVEELDARLAEGQAENRDLLLIDTRSAEEFAVSHLQGAVHAETAAEVRQVLAATDPSRPVVLYCSVGYRSARLAQELAEEGIPAATGHGEVMNLEGSIFAWANSGRPVYRDGREVTKVHPYDARWGKLLRDDLRAER